MQGIVTVRFTSRWPYNPCSPIIARLSGSRVYSHCMNIIDGVAYEASMTHGCRVVPQAVAMQGIVVYQDMYVPVPDIAASIRFGQEQNGKPYDWAALALPLLASDDWDDLTKWWCSELAFIQLGRGGTWLLDPAEEHRVRPSDLVRCNFPKSAVIRVAR